MEIVLTYKGELKTRKARKIVQHKHEIRKIIHKQLKILWEQEHLKKYLDDYIPKVEQNHKDGLCFYRELEGFRFAPLICRRLNLLAELNITFLRKENPGIIVGGDIDNRIKTLLDALKIPKEKQEIPANILPEEEENPFFCLLEDDHLLTGISVMTHYWLETPRVNEDSEVFVLMKIKTKEYMPEIFIYIND